ncbi:MAG: efflux RND transporter periplasmic adaptor subunit [Alphaproteobacteria bacterium]
MSISSVKEWVMLNKVKSLAALAIIGAAAFKFSATSAGTQIMPEIKQEVTVSVIRPVDTPVTFNFSAITEGSKEVEIRSQVTGILQSQLFQDGKIVKADDTLFKIDPRQFEIAVSSAKSGLLKAQAELSQSEKDEARLKNLIARKAISQKEYDDSYAKLQMSKANYISANTKLDEAKLNLSYTTIKAPISGSVSKAFKNEGALINASETLLTKIIQLDPIYANFSVSENDFVKLDQNIAKGIIKMPDEKKLNVELRYGDNILYSHIGHVSFSDSEIKKGTGVIEVRTSFPNPENHLIPGQFVKLKLIGAYRPNSIVIPKRSVINGIAGSAVFVINELNKATSKDVQVGDEIGDNIQILSGLKAGDKVIVDGSQKVQNGMEVTISSVIEHSHEEQVYMNNAEQAPHIQEEASIQNEQQDMDKV